MTNGKNLRLRWLAAASFLLMTCIPSLALAQAGSLAGTVVDDEGTPVPKVQIRLDPEASLSSRPRTLETDDEGEFVIAGLTPGRYTMTYSKEGYESATQDIQVRIAQRNRLGEIVLPRLPQDYIDPSAQEFFDAGVSATDAGDYAKAIESFEKVLELAPDVPEVHYNLGIAYEESGNVEKAIVQYEKAIELRPDYVAPMIPLSDYYTKNKDWAKAAEYLKRATELQPNELAPQYNLGAVSMNMGDMETAEAAFNKVLEIDPTRAMAHYQLGMIAVSQARNDEALAHLEEYVELEPTGPMAVPAQNIIDTLKKSQP